MKKHIIILSLIIVLGFLFVHPNSTANAGLFTYMAAEDASDKAQKALSTNKQLLDLENLHFQTIQKQIAEINAKLDKLIECDQFAKDSNK